MSGVTDTDRGWRAMLARAREIAQGRTVKVGILDDAPKEERGGGTSVLSLVEVALIHEFGAPGRGIPQRSFIRTTIDEHAAEIRTLLTATAARALEGSITPQQALGQVGAKVASWIQTRITAGIAPPLKPATIARKGSSKPLVDSGQLKSAITWKVSE